MSKQPTKIVFFGSEAWGVPSLAALAKDSSYEIAAVVTRPDAPSGRKRLLTPTPVKAAALELGLSVLEPQSLSELLPWIDQTRPRLGILIAYGKLIPDSIIEAFPLGILNLHPSALPKYRGPSPVEAAILAGETPGDVSVIQLTKEMDAGPIVAQTKLKLPKAKTLSAADAYTAIGKEAVSLLLEAANNTIGGTATTVKQDDAEATFSQIVTKADAQLDPTRPATELEGQIRAYSGWPGSEIVVNGQRLLITAAHVGDTMPFGDASSTGAAPGTLFATRNGELALVTGHGELIIDRLIIPGKSETTGKAYLAGHRRTK